MSDTYLPNRIRCKEDLLREYEENKAEIANVKAALRVLQDLVFQKAYTPQQHNAFATVAMYISKYQNLG